MTRSVRILENDLIQNMSESEEDQPQDNSANTNAPIATVLPVVPPIISQAAVLPVVQPTIVQPRPTPVMHYPDHYTMCDPVTLVTLRSAWTDPYVPYESGLNDTCYMSDTSSCGDEDITLPGIQSESIECFIGTDEEECMSEESEDDYMSQSSSDLDIIDIQGELQSPARSPPAVEPEAAVQNSPDAPVVSAQSSPEPVVSAHTRAAPITKQCSCHFWVRTVYADPPTKATDTDNWFSIPGAENLKGAGHIEFKPREGDPEAQRGIPRVNPPTYSQLVGRVLTKGVMKNIVRGTAQKIKINDDAGARTAKQILKTHLSRGKNGRNQICWYFLCLMAMKLINCPTVNDFWSPESNPQYLWLATIYSRRLFHLIN